ncbi:hypothetical protein J6590_022767 [Homalodisca vitripennis]|nr:hypothetical protein J6590_022767 [Homalodisca vitripennis]
MYSAGTFHRFAIEQPPFTPERQDAPSTHHLPSHPPPYRSTPLPGLIEFSPQTSFQITFIGKVLSFCSTRLPLLSALCSETRFSSSVQLILPGRSRAFYKDLAIHFSSITLHRVEKY